jgi:hypothetical protein
MSTNKSSFFFPLLVGIVVGVLGTIYLPGYVRPYLPEWIAGKTVVVKGTVEAKQKKDNVLLLTVETPQGVLLATFKRKVDEINLLINEKDSIEFTLPKYAPFIEDPRIVRVVKGQQAVPEPVPAAVPKAQPAKEPKPRRQEKQPVAAPAPASGLTGTAPANRK